MGKKNKEDIPNPNSVSNRDIIQRLNFLYQASVLLGNISAASDGAISPDTSPIIPHDSSAQYAKENRKRHRKRSRRVVNTLELSRSYVDTMKIVGQKTNVKIDPTVKRVICKGCSVILVPGTTAKIRVKTSKSHGHLVTYSCIGCKTSRRIPAPPTLHVDTSSSASASGHATSEAAPTNQESAMTDCPPTGNVVQRSVKKSVVPRLPPHFARDIGHVVFCGNEKLGGDRA
ncbi:Rpr2-domain-containing protein [Leucogyrophana mollusca]|uniref:Rpr2-domain-containing protein n=1 Tax=Leucogyrophana mollusca TaxID=85980 RepID=A0ACB8B2T6_9AGAM|nr:Rpr2-domain-containing protein [Leucogyrophana mollusca]